MTKDEFFAGTLFDMGDGYEYQFRESCLPEGMGGVGTLRRRLAGQHIDWAYCGSVQIVNQRGVRVFMYWFGKRVSRFLFYNKLPSVVAKPLATNFEAR